jgi:hypothetical protein
MSDAIDRSGAASGSTRRYAERALRVASSLTIAARINFRGGSRDRGTGRLDAEKLRASPWRSSGIPPESQAATRPREGVRVDAAPASRATRLAMPEVCRLLRHRRCERGASTDLSNGVECGPTTGTNLAQPCWFGRSGLGGVGYRDGFASQRSPVRSRYARYSESAHSQVLSARRCRGRQQRCERGASGPTDCCDVSSKLVE